MRGQRALSLGGEKSFAFELRLQPQERLEETPRPVRRTASTFSCSSPRGSYIVTSARTSILSPSRGVNSRVLRAAAEHHAAICACWSLIEKYQWPLAARVKFETSPGHPHERKRAFQQRADRAVQHGNGMTASPPCGDRGSGFMAASDSESTVRTICRQVDRALKRTGSVPSVHTEGFTEAALDRPGRAVDRPSALILNTIFIETVLIADATLSRRGFSAFVRQVLHRVIHRPREARCMRVGGPRDWRPERRRARVPGSRTGRQAPPGRARFPGESR